KDVVPISDNRPIRRRSMKANRLRRTLLVVSTGLVLLLGVRWTAWSQSQPGPKGQAEPGARAMDRMLVGGDEVSQIDPAVYADGAGAVYRLWIDSLRNEGGDVRFQRSADDGQTWSAPMALDRDKPEHGVSTMPTLMIDGERVVAMWRTKFRGDPGGK